MKNRSKPNKNINKEYKKLAKNDDEKKDEISIKEVKLKFEDHTPLGQREYLLVDEEGNNRIVISSIKQEIMKLWRNHKYDGDGFNKKELIGPGLTYGGNRNCLVFVIDSHKGLNEMSVVELGREIEYALERTNLEDKKLSPESANQLYKFKLKRGEIDKLAQNTPNKKIREPEDNLK